MSADDVIPLPIRRERPQIVTGPELSRIADEAVGLLAERAPELYRHGTSLAEVVVEDPRTRGVTRAGPIAHIRRVTEDRVLDLLSREAQWLAPDGGGGLRQVAPPRSIARVILARGSWAGVRPIVAVATAPTLRVDGSILSAPGYDVATGIYMAPSVEVTVAAAPTTEDARRAVDMLLDLIADFPAVTPAARSAWLAGLLAVVVRPAIEGPIPMIIVDATVRGAGKSMLVDVAAIIATGRPAARMIYSRDDAEVRKVITAVLIAGDPIVAFDNVVGELGTASLDAALTGETWRDRVLGSSAMTAELPIRIAWYATGNGLVVGADLSRRALLVRLEPAVERPEERTGWRYPRLLDHVRDHRAELLSAALTIARAYVVAGRPDMGLRPMGSYDRWSDLARSAVVWAGCADPCETVADLRASDARTDALRVAILAWPAGDGEPVTAADLIDLAGTRLEWRAALVDWVPPRGSELPTSRALSYALRAVRGRIIAGIRIDGAVDRRGVMHWNRRRVAGDDGHDGDPQATTPVNRSAEYGAEMPVITSIPGGEEGGMDTGGEA